MVVVVVVVVVVVEASEVGGAVVGAPDTSHKPVTPTLSVFCETTI